MSGKGYKLIHLPNHPRANNKGWVYEHYVVAEQKLGRYLQDKETVHHIDGNKTNNDPDNLIVFATSADHSGCHAGAEIYEKDNIWYAKIRTANKRCEYCNGIFKPNHMNQRFCSRECVSQQKIKEHKMTYDIDLIQTQLKQNNGNFTKTAKIFGVTANALVKRLKANELPYHSKDYR